MDTEWWWGHWTERCKYEYFAVGARTRTDSCAEIFKIPTQSVGDTGKKSHDT